MMLLHRLTNNGAALLCAALLCACGTSKRVEVTASATETAKPVDAPALSADEQARFNYFYLEAQAQKYKEQYDAFFELLEHCLEIDPNSPEALYDLGKYYFGLQDTAKCEAYIERAVQLSPDNYWYKEMLTAVYRKQHEYEKAAAVYEDMARMFPTRKLETLGQLVNLYTICQEYDKVLETLDKMEAAEGKNEQISGAKVLIYQQTGQSKKAYKELETLAKENPTDVRYSLTLGDLYLANGKTKEALAIYQEAKSHEPNNPAVLLSLSSYYKETGDSLRYRQQLDSLLYNPSTDTKIKISILQQYAGDELRNEVDSTEVLKRFRIATAEPQDDATLLLLYAQYMAVQDFPPDSLIPVLKKALEVEPEDVNTRLALAQQYLTKKDYANIAAVCNEGTQYSPEILNFYFLEGQSYYSMDKKEEALQAFQRGLKAINATSNPSMVSDLYAIIGDMLHDRGRETESYAMYDSSLVYKYDNVGCLNNYAYYLSLKKTRLDEAEKMSYRTIKAEPKNKTFLDTYAWVLFVQKRYNEAKTYIDQVVPPDSLGVIERDSTINGGVVEHAGDIYYMAGDRDRALLYWQKAEKMGEASAALPRKIRLKKYVEE